MSGSNGVIRIGRKGIKKFAFGEDGAPFDVDVVTAFQQWIGVDDSFRQTEGDDRGTVRTEDMAAYHRAAVDFVQAISGDRAVGGTDITTAEALDFLARLSEQYNELARFFRPKRLEEVESPATSGAELRFSVEGAN